MRDRKKTELGLLLDLCNAAVQADLAEQSQAEHEEADEIVRLGAAYAKDLLGDEAAARLGEWIALDRAAFTDEDGEVSAAAVEIAGSVQLVYRSPIDSAVSLSLISYCRYCHHHRDVPIGSLTDLAAALQRQGLR